MLFSKYQWPIIELHVDLDDFGVYFFWNGLIAKYKILAKQTNSTKAPFWFNLQYKPTSTKFANSNRNSRYMRKQEQYSSETCKHCTYQHDVFYVYVTIISYCGNKCWETTSVWSMMTIRCAPYCASGNLTFLIIYWTFNFPYKLDHSEY